MCRRLEWFHLNSFSVNLISGLFRSDYFALRLIHIQLIGLFIYCLICNSRKFNNEPEKKKIGYGYDRKGESRNIKTKSQGKDAAVNIL
jgi:hypothetical protein